MIVMGLDMTHNAWHSSYSWFVQYRVIFAEAAGYKVEFVGFDKDPSGHFWYLPITPITEFQKLGMWEKHLEDPLLYLLCHSDCEGWLLYPYLEPLKDRLKELLPKAIGIAEKKGCGPQLEESTNKLIVGISQAIENQEHITLC